MKTFLKALLLIPVAAIVVFFAVMNRGPVTLELDPLSLWGGGMPLRMPLFILVFVALGIGVVLGGVAVWFTQSRHRRAARIASRELARHREELDRLRAAPGTPALPHASAIR
jgi:hypothetical protein